MENTATASFWTRTGYFFTGLLFAPISSVYFAYESETLRTKIDALKGNKPEPVSIPKCIVIGMVFLGIAGAYYSQKLLNQRETLSYLETMQRAGNNLSRSQEVSREPELAQQMNMTPQWQQKIEAQRGAASLTQSEQSR